MTNKVLEKLENELDEEQAGEMCVHHWIIEPPERPVSKGVCQKCGVEREFQNYFPYSKWETA